MLQEGDIKFIDKDGDGNVTEKDRTVIGNPNPSYRYGLSTRAAWRNLSLTVTMDGAADFDIMNLNLLNTATFATGNYSNLRSDSYRKAYPAGGEPRLNAVGADVVSSRFVEDGSYLRLSNVQVSYRFDIGRKWLRSVDLAFTAKNLCVLTGYSGYSPIVQLSTQPPLVMNTRSFSVRSTRSASSSTSRQMVLACFLPPVSSNSMLVTLVL